MKSEDKITEQPSHYDHLEQMSVGELLQHINEEDALVVEAVRKAMGQIQASVEASATPKPRNDSSKRVV